MAHRAFDEIQKEMQAIAADMARDQKSSEADYRAVIRNLKKQRRVGEAILPHYQHRLTQLEDIIRSKNLVTVPDPRREFASPAPQRVRSNRRRTCVPHV
jgi:hypothetical protein